MNVKRTVIVILLFALFAVVLSGCSGKNPQPETTQPKNSLPENPQPETTQSESSQPESSESSQPANPQLKKELAQYTEMLQSGKVSELKMTIYYMDPWILTRYPLGVNDLKSFTDGRVTVSGEKLLEQIDLLKELSAENLQLTSSEYLNARFCCEFSNTSGEVLLTFALWGVEGKSIYVNGIAVEENEVFYKLLIPHIPEEDIKQHLIDGPINIKG